MPRIRCRPSLSEAFLCDCSCVAAPHTAMASLASEWTEERFLEAHQAQLASQNIPEHLWPVLFKKLQAMAFDAGESFTFGHAPEEPLPHKQFSVHAVKDLMEEEDIWLVEHIWMFKSPADALEMLKRYENVMERMVVLTNMKFDEDATTEERADLMIEELQRYAYPIVDSTGGRMHYVMDELGSRVTFALQDEAVANVKYATVVDMMSGEMLSVFWCIGAIKKHECVYRAPQHRMSLVGLKKKAWEIRFEYEQQYDWYCEYNEGSPLRNLILQSAPKRDGKVLIVGTGSSTMPMEMYKDGFTDIVATDYVAAIIKKMAEKHPPKDYHNAISWQELDATNISGGGIDAASMDYIIDKGCLDALLVRDGVEGSGEGQESWMTEEPEEVTKMVQEIEAALSPTGLYLLTSFGSPTYLVNTVDFERGGLFLKSCFQIERDAEQLKKDSRVPGAAALTSGHEFYFFVFSKVQEEEVSEETAATSAKDDSNNAEQ